MLSFLKKIFNANKNIVKSPRFAIVKKSLKSKINLYDVNQIYYLGGVEYSKERHKEAIKSIEDNKILQFLERFIFNTHKDNLDIYLVDSKENHQAYIVLMLSPYEFFESDYVLDIIEISKTNLLLLLNKESELVYKV